jgi:hypothetical protein
MEKRILATWDFHSVPHSVGDIITFLERLEIECIEHNINTIDFCFLFDSEHPARTHRFNGQGKLEEDVNQNITVNNFHTLFIPLFSAVFISKRIGNFFIFNEYKRFYKFIELNQYHYIFVPKTEDVLNKKHYYKESFKIVDEYYKKNKKIPYLECRQGTIQHINLFFSEKIFPKYPVVVHIRNTKGYDDRNSSQEEWKKFFNECENKYKEIMFILIGTKNDTQNFKGLSNIIISKDYFNTFEEDMILIKQSLLFLGTRSGPLMMAFFTGVPCIIFDYNLAPHEKCDFGKNFDFMNSCQKLIWRERAHPAANCKVILDEFEKLYKSINKDEWKVKIENNKNNNKSYLELI